MSNTNHIHIVSDDLDDKEIIQDIWKDLHFENKLVFYSDGSQLIEELNHGSNIPFIILCDVNLPGMNGFEIREQLYRNPQTRYKTVPFIFWSNSASEAQIKRAYDLGAHGMFIKGSSIKELKNTFIKIIDYWQSSLKPKKLS